MDNVHPKHFRRQLAFQTLYALDFTKVTSLDDLELFFLKTEETAKTGAEDLSPRDQRKAREARLAAEGDAGQDPALEQAAKPRKNDLAWEIVFHVWKLRDELDDIIRRNANRPLERIGNMELSILRMGVYELVKPNPEDTKIILNEAVLLAQEFGEDPAYQFINGVLHSVGTMVKEQGLSLQKPLPEYR